jgi:DNA-binding NtrC family response regulator
MLEKNSLIFVVEDDIPCGKLMQYYLTKNGYKNVWLYTHEKDCLANFKRHPDVLITDYRLKSMNGINLIQKAKKIYPDFYCILLSGFQPDDIFDTEISKQYIDVYIRKGLNCMNKLIYVMDSYIHARHVEQVC